jgi:hypothetical protein
MAELNCRPLPCQAAQAKATKAQKRHISAVSRGLWATVKSSFSSFCSSWQQEVATKLPPIVPAAYEAIAPKNGWCRGRGPHALPALLWSIVPLWPGVDNDAHAGPLRFKHAGLAPRSG